MSSINSAVVLLHTINHTSGRLTFCPHFSEGAPMRKIAKKYFGGVSFLTLCAILGSFFPFLRLFASVKNLILVFSLLNLC